MSELLNKKAKFAILGITLLGIGSVIAKSLYEYSTYKILKSIEKNFENNK